MKLGSHKLTFQLKWEFLEILCKVAESYPPSTDRENEIIARYTKDLRVM